MPSAITEKPPTAPVTSEFSICDATTSKACKTLENSKAPPNNFKPSPKEAALPISNLPTYPPA